MSYCLGPLCGRHVPGAPPLCWEEVYTVHSLSLSSPFLSLLSSLSFLFVLPSAPSSSIAHTCPSFVETFPEFNVAMARLQSFLVLSSSSTATPPQSSLATLVPTPPPSPNDVLVDLNDVTLTYTNATDDVTTPPFSLACKHFSVRGHELVGVLGPVGAGKTTLLESLLGEVPHTGSLQVTPTRIAYVGQSPWIFAGTLRDNIVFHAEYDPARYASVLHACALVEDIAQLPAGDMTEIGEKGVNLSGGQKARVCLARACYSSAPLVLLDDPLSAVDHAVGEHIFAHAVCGLLAARAVVLVTHHPHFVAQCDHAFEITSGRVVSADVSAISHKASSFSVAGDKKKKTDTNEEEEAEGEDRDDEQDDGKAKSAKDSAPAKEKSQIVLAEDRKLGTVGAKTYTVHGHSLSFCLSLSFFLSCSLSLYSLFCLFSLLNFTIFVHLMPHHRITCDLAARACL